MALLKKWTSPDAPKHLSKTGKAMWISIVAEYQLETHQLEILRLLCECLDRLEVCRRRLKKDGLFIRDRFEQTKAHPALAEEREHRVLVMRLARELNLDIELPAESRKPARY